MQFKTASIAALSLPAVALAQGAANASQDACGKVAAQIQGGATEVKATDAQACLHAIPFNQFNAQQFLTQFNDTNLAFQSNTAYLKNPPKSWQQPQKDLLNAIENIQDKMNIGTYVNEYDYEADFVTLICQASHSGMTMNSNTLSQFTFKGPLRIASVSSDGQALPEIYAFDDLNQTANGWTPSPMATVNGNDALVYFEKFASVYPQNQIETHGDYQSLMTNAAADVGSYPTTWQNSNLFQDIQFNVTFKNGSNFLQNYTATVNNPGMWSNVSSGKDYFDTFVTPTETHNEVMSAAGAAATGVYEPLSTVGANLEAWPQPAYPSPFVVQPSLGNGGWVTGYMVDDAKMGQIGVLSIPSFGFGGPNNGQQSLPATVQNFVQTCQTAGVKNVMIDLQGNYGGNENDAVEVFKHFFPQTEPFYGSRIRVHDAVNSIGTAFSGFWEKNGGFGNQSLVETLDANPWIAQVYDNAATGQHFSGWQELINGYVANGDTFTQTQLTNWTDPVFDAHEVRFQVTGFGNATNGTSAQPFPASNIALLTDSRCAGACSVFMEMMVHQGGVKTVAVGGAPSTGPMQASGGFRGTQFSVADLNNNLGFLSGIDPSIAPSLPQFNWGIQANTTDLKFNLRDLVRKNETFPLQMAYEAADCRIFYTLNTVNNYTNLWSYAANAVFTNTSMCVQDSTGQASTTTNMNGPSNPGSGLNVSSSTGGLAPHLRKRSEGVSLMGRGLTQLISEGVL